MHTSSSGGCTGHCSGTGGSQAPSSSSEASPCTCPHKSLLLTAFSFLYTITIPVSNISNSSLYPSTRSSAPPPLSLSWLSLTSSFPAPFSLASSTPSSLSLSV